MSGHQATPSPPGTRPHGTAAPGDLLLVLLAFTVLGILPSQRLYWDDIGFLRWAEAGHRGDIAHLLYPLAIRTAAVLTRPFGLGFEAAAKLLSALGGALVLLLATRRARAAGLPEPWPAATALLLVGAHLLWRQASVVEPSTLALAALLFTAERARAYGQERTGARCLALVSAALLALGLHIVTAVALPWWFLLARGNKPVPKRHFVALGFATLIAASAFALLGPGLGAFMRNAASFVPAGESASGIGAHAKLLAAVFTEGAPLLSICALAAIGSMLVTRTRPSSAWLALSVPHAVLFLLFAKPVVALSLPLFVVLFELIVRALRARTKRPGPLALLLSIAVALAVAIGVGHSLRHAFHLAAAPDAKRLGAESLAASTPPNSLVVAGPLARHISWWTELPVIELPNKLHAAMSQADPKGSILEFVAQESRAALAHPGIDRVWITEEALTYLEERWSIDPASLRSTSATVAPQAELTLYLLGGTR